MSNVIAFPAPAAKDPALQTADDILFSVERIGDAARQISEMDMDGAKKVEALVALFDSAQLLQKAAVIVGAVCRANRARPDFPKG
jgi:hypothetical protein